MRSAAQGRAEWAEPFAPGPGRPSAIEEAEEQTVAAEIASGAGEELLTDRDDSLVDEELAMADDEGEVAPTPEEEPSMPPAESALADLPESEVFPAEDVGDVMVDVDDHALAPALEEPEAHETAVAEEGSTPILEEEGDDIDYPDYIFGTDRTAAESGTEAEASPEASVAAEAAEAEGVRRETETDPAEELARLAEQLLQGPESPAMQQLLKELEGLPAAEIVARAFAAGYRIAREEEG